MAEKESPPFRMKLDLRCNWAEGTPSILEISDRTIFCKSKGAESESYILDTFAQQCMAMGKHQVNSTSGVYLEEQDS